MLGTLKAEIRKLYTVRSTYAILIFCLILMGLFAFWGEGIKAGDNLNPGSTLITDPHKLSGLLMDAIGFLSFFGSLVGILLITAEYRYNTITYTLTASRSRTKILLAKVVAISLFSVFFTLFVTILAPALMYLGLSIKGFELVPQTLYADLIWRALFMAWGYGMLGLLLGTLIRQQVGAISAFFAIPIFIEPLLTTILKEKAIYLPYNVITQVASSEMFKNALPHGKAALIFLGYLAIGWIAAWYLFLRRDAN